MSGGKVEDVMVARAALKTGGFDTQATDEVIDKVKPEVTTKQTKKKK